MFPGASGPHYPPVRNRRRSKVLASERELTVYRNIRREVVSPANGATRGLGSAKQTRRRAGNHEAARIHQIDTLTRIPPPDQKSRVVGGAGPAHGYRRARPNAGPL